jgi:hypothetical protein
MNLGAFTSETAKFYFRFSENYDLLRVSRLHQRGASRSSRTWEAGCDGRKDARDERGRCGRQSRVVLISRRWDQARERSRRRRWPKSPEHRGEHGAAVNTIRAGNAGLFRRTCSDLLACFFHCTQGCGCDKHPAFLAPSDFRGTRCSKARAFHAARTQLLVIASEAKQSMPPQADRWIASSRSLSSGRALRGPVGSSQ